jgi:hypothetical protein
MNYQKKKFDARKIDQANQKMAVRIINARAKVDPVEKLDRLHAQKPTPQ